MNFSKNWERKSGLLPKLELKQKALNPVCHIGPTRAPKLGFLLGFVSSSLSESFSPSNISIHPSIVFISTIEAIEAGKKKISRRSSAAAAAVGKVAS